jgi:hypothetical protein
MALPPDFGINGGLAYVAREHWPRLTKMEKPREPDHSVVAQDADSGVLQQPASGTARTRRRMLGAMLGTPVIYTLPSGALQAAGSVLCDMNDENVKAFAGTSTPPPPWGTVGTEEFTGYTSDGTQWVTNSCWSSIHVTASGGPDQSSKIA